MGIPFALRLPALLLVATTVSAGASKPHAVTGHGGVPVSPSVTSMWGAIDEPAGPGETPLTFMIYFRGAKGWHAGRHWKMSVRTGDEPAVIEFAGDGITLRAEYSRDRPGSEKVLELAKVDLHVPPGINPALWLLEQSPAVRKALGPER